MALVIVGLLLQVAGAPFASAALTIGGGVLVLVLAVLAWELVARRD